MKHEKLKKALAIIAVVLFTATILFCAIFMTVSSDSGEGRVETTTLKSSVSDSSDIVTYASWTTSDYRFSVPQISYYSFTSSDPHQSNNGRFLTLNVSGYIPPEAGTYYFLVARSFFGYDAGNYNDITYFNVIRYSASYSSTIFQQYISDDTFYHYSMLTPQGSSSTLANIAFVFEPFKDGFDIGDGEDFSVLNFDFVIYASSSATFDPLYANTIFDFYEYGQIDGNVDGWVDGYADGIEDGYLNGYDEGFEDGNTGGYNSGFLDGEEAGYREGYSAGSSDGYEEGYVNGMNKVQSDSLTNPVNYFLEPVHQFLNYNLFGVLSIGRVLNIVLFVSVALIFIKMFSGG